MSHHQPTILLAIFSLSLDMPWHVYPVCPECSMDQEGMMVGGSTCRTALWHVTWRTPKRRPAATQDRAAERRGEGAAARGDDRQCVCA